MAGNGADAPEVDQWYRDGDGELFKVVAIESEGEAIEVQHYEGAVAELDSQAWREREPRLAAPPENWSGSMDMSQEDYRTSNDEEGEPEGGNPLDRLEDFD